MLIHIEDIIYSSLFPREANSKLVKAFPSSTHDSNMKARKLKISFIKPKSCSVVHRTLSHQKGTGLILANCCALLIIFLLVE